MAGVTFYERLGLACGIASPLLYFLSQAAAAPFYAGYDWTTQLASELGAGSGPAAIIFNAGMALTGCATILAALTFYRVLRTLSAKPGSAAAVALSLLSSGGATLWAGLHPLPSPVHNPGLWGIGTVVAPLAMLWALRRPKHAAWLRAYLAGTFALAILVLVLIAAEVAPAGSMQRIAAVLVYPPTAVVALFLWRQRRHQHR